VAKETHPKVPINSQFGQPSGPTQDVGMPNPATPSADIAGLFPHGVAAAELRIPGDPALLYPEESASVARAVRSRAQEFAAGRLCARRALAEFGIRDFPLRSGSDRAPLWPGSMVGSITHTDGFCAAVVAERRCFLALGLDTEVAGDLKRQLWPRICVAAERAWLESLPASAQPAAATLIFSAKEAFYKCQYPVTQERLRFSDLHVGLAESDEVGRNGQEGTVLVMPTRPLSIATSISAPLRGHFRVHHPYVSVAMYLLAAAPLIDPTESTPRRPPTSRG
jgi:4'-phosphopantetheinyl transferase EntD